MKNEDDSTELTLPRFKTETEAAECAKRLSAAQRSTYYVIDSPLPPDSEDVRVRGVDPDARFCVDDDGYTRSWERTCSVWTNGQEDKDG